MKHTELLKKLRDGHYEINDEAADAIESLQAEVERLTLACNKAAQAELDLLAERAALKLDAERYRFLISDASDKNCVSPEQSLLVDEVWQRVLDCGGNYTKSDVDYAIDAAMKGAA